MATREKSEKVILILNYNRLFTKYRPVIKYYSQKLNRFDYEDHMQDICVYILKHIDNFDIQKSSLKYYFCLMVITAYRKLIYDKTKQTQFELSFSELIGDAHLLEEDSSQYDVVIQKTVEKLDERDITIFYAIVYNKNHDKLNQVARLLKMNYNNFLERVDNIKKVMSEVMKNE